MALSLKINHFTEQLKHQGLLRTRQVSAGGISFDSNDYLSLRRDKRIQSAYQCGYQKYPSGSSGSMVLNGYHERHRAVEQAFAERLHVDECILFSSGYAANLAVMSLLGRIQAHCVIDKNIHASIYDGLRLGQVSYARYIHNNIPDLTKKLALHPGNQVLITEGIFSMSGQLAPLSAISSVCIAHQSELIVDEAHSFGVLGDKGMGAVVAHQLNQKQVPLRIIPLGKAFAAQGAIIAGQHEWLNAVLQAGRSFIYSTAISPALSYGLLKTLDVVAASDERRARLGELITLFQSYIKTSPLRWMVSSSPIQQVHLGCPQLAMYYAQELRKKGFNCSAIRRPTVNTKSTGLRIILNYHHQPEQIAQLFHLLHKLYDDSLR